MIFRSFKVYLWNYPGLFNMHKSRLYRSEILVLKVILDTQKLKDVCYADKEVLGKSSRCNNSIDSC